VILISAEGKHFTAGMDLGNFTDSDLAGKDEHQGLQNEAIYRLTKDLQYSFSSLEKSRIPVIVAIQGACIGGGVDMISACDIRYATSDAFFCIQETNLGLVADVGTLQRLPKLIPEGIVRDLALTGRKMMADEAERYGLISAIFDDHESMLDHAMDTAREIASKSPLAISGIKEIINYSRDHSVDESLNYVALWNAAMKYEDDLKETFLAKMEKRDELFQGLKKKGKYFDN
jgi:enoyl-CoA hydratase